jgi:hypothetical protein
VRERELFVDCVRRLNSAGLAHMLTGSMASSHWGQPRLTHDLDFVIQLPPSQVSGLVKVFRDDYFIDEASVAAAFQPPYQFNVLDNRSAMKIDFWLLKPDLFEQEMFRRRVQVRAFGERAWIATAEDVLLHKLYWDAITPSERQRSDAAGVFAVQQGQMDLAYLRRWAAELGVIDTLEAILSGRIKPKTT